MFGFKSVKSIFQKEMVKVEHLKMANQVSCPVSELPEILKRYFSFCGYTGEECIRSVTVRWRDAMLKFSPEGEWKNLDCVQINLLPAPLRLVYMKTWLYRLIPFEAIDEYLAGHGTMLIKIFNFFTITRATGKEMDKAELVTVLAEMMIVPAYALQHYIRWETISPLCQKATITVRDTSASGLFYFAETGQVLRFETNDRCYTAKDGSYEQMKWTAVVKGVHEVEGIKTPSTFTAMWHMPDQDYEYFKGNIADISISPFITYSINQKLPSFTLVNHA
jgi:hypothetical protein